MSTDNALVERVGRENVIGVCKQLGCMLHTTCFPRNGAVNLCQECYDALKDGKRFDKATNAEA